MIAINWNPTHGQLRSFAAIAFLFFGGLGAWLLAYGSGAGWLLVAVAVAMGVAGAIRPPTLRVVYVLLASLTRPIGWALSHVIIAVLFYGVITPMGWIRRKLGRDPLALHASPDAESYWVPRSQPDDGSSYLRQS